MAYQDLKQNLLKNKISIMKDLQLVVTCCLLVISSTLLNCGDEPIKISEQERVESLLLVGSWKIQQVKIDGSDKTQMFTDLTLKFANGSFTTTKGEPVWPSSGSWVFDDETAKSFTRTDGVAVNIEEINESSLRLSLLWTQTTYGSGRSSSISGMHVFSFIK